MYIAMKPVFEARANFERHQKEYIQSKDRVGEIIVLVANECKVDGSRCQDQCEK